MSQSSEDSQPFELFNRRSRGDDNNHIGVDENVENAAEQPAAAAPAPPAAEHPVAPAPLYDHL